MTSDLHRLKKAAQELSQRYRNGLKPYLRSRLDREAYLITRLPATRAALVRVLEEISRDRIETYLDVGAGPGTSWEAMCHYWGDRLRATFVERDRDFVEIGMATTPKEQVQWICEPASKFKEHDLVLFSYSWGEIDHLETLANAWAAAKKYLVVVEPGTPRGYEKVLKAREWCIEHGGVVVAPCPHSKRCPWQGTDDWCHFGVRLERSAGHRMAKEGVLGYEDEKFSYVILSKNRQEEPHERLLKDPLQRKRHLILTLCTTEGVIERAVTKSDDHYKSIKKLRWGDRSSSSLPGKENQTE